VPAGDPRFNGLVLVDLPDHDSTLTAHRDEVDRLVALVDGFVWVVDPQKYADKALHARYLRPMASYADVMIVVLNQADLLEPDELKATVAHLRSVLDDAGLSKVPLITTSALSGQGIDELRSMVAELVASKRAAASRLATDVHLAAKGLAVDVSRQRRREISGETRQQLLGALQQAAGLPQVVAGVAQATRQRGAAATGWPVVSWINTLKPDPLARLRTGAMLLPGLGGAVASAQVDGALRQLGVDVSVGMKPGWAKAVRAAITPRDELQVELDAALAKVDLGVDKPAPWWRVVRYVQWGLIGVVLVGLIWAIIGGSSAPAWRGLPWPLILGVGGALAGVVLALICHAAIRFSAKRRANQVASAYGSRIAEVAEVRVLGPVTEELERYAEFVGAVARAL